MRALFDTGASRTFVREDAAKNIEYRRFSEPRYILTAAREKGLEVVGMSFFETGIEGCKVPWALHTSAHS